MTMGESPSFNGDTGESEIAQTCQSRYLQSAKPEKIYWIQFYGISWPRAILDVH